MLEPVKQKSRYMAGLDGLRALAVAAVIAYHLHPGSLPGGLLGVGVFFVLSGYLITDLLVAEWKRSGHIDLCQFWLRRAKRLLPGMFLMLIAVSAWLAITDPVRLFSLQGDLTAALLYVSNWWSVFHEVSYFESFGPPSPLGHFWSLAVEEQFYLIWPVVVVVGLQYWRRRSTWLGITLLAAAASAVWMAYLYEPGTDPSRVYYGTDTRAFGLLFGAALAFICPSAKLALIRSRIALAFIDAGGFLGLTIIVIMVLKTGQYDGFLYQGGFVVFSVMSALVILALAQPTSLLGELLGSQPLRWLGLRSYGLYLWHYPVIVLSGSNVSNGEFDLIQAIGQVTVTIILAALSYRFVEMPVRNGALSVMWAQLLRGKPRFLAALRLRMMASACIVVLLCASCMGEGKMPAVNASSDPATAVIYPALPPDSINSTPSPTSTPEAEPTPIPEATPAQDTIVTSSASETSDISVAVVPESPPPQEPSNNFITAVGDSIMIGATPQLEKLLPGIVINGKIGRQMIQAQDTINEMKAAGSVGNRVVIELGTNGPFPKKTLESLLRSLADADRIVLVNTRVPRPWEEEVNTMLKETAANFANVKLVDWYSASADKEGIFAEDGVHLTPKGAPIYASLIVKALQE